MCGRVVPVSVTNAPKKEKKKSKFVDVTIWVGIIVAEVKYVHL